MDIQTLFAAVVQVVSLPGAGSRASDIVGS